MDSAAQDVSSLTDGSWTGDHATDFANAWADLRTSGDQIMAALTELAEKLGVTAHTYQARDENNAGAIQNSSLDLP